MGTPQLDDHQLVGVLLFIGALIASVVLPYLSARSVTGLKRFVYRESTAGDRLLVFDLLLFAMFGQLVIVVGEVFDDVHFYVGRPYDLAQTWRYAIWPDHELRLRTGIFLILLTFPVCVAVRLRYLHHQDETEPSADTLRSWNGIGLVVLGAVLLANLYAAWMLDILGW